MILKQCVGEGVIVQFEAFFCHFCSTTTVDLLMSDYFVNLICVLGVGFQINK